MVWPYLALARKVFHQAPNVVVFFHPRCNTFKQLPYDINEEFEFIIIAGQTHCIQP